MEKRGNPRTTTHYYPDGRAIVEVLHEGEGGPLHYVFLQERPEVSFVGVFRDVTTPGLDASRRVEVNPSEVDDHSKFRVKAREMAIRALAQGPLRRLIAAVTTCFYSGREHWQCLAEKHGLRRYDVKADPHEGKG